MVKVREDYPVNERGQVDVPLWIASVVALAPARYRPEGLIAACETSLKASERRSEASNLWDNGASSFITGLEMARILADLQLDEETLQAAILYRAVRENRLPIEEVRADFGERVAKLIEGVLQMAANSKRRADVDGKVLGLHSEEQSDNIRRMLVTMIDDVRVALIKLAERTCAIRAVKDSPEEKRQRVAREVAEIYAPLAQRLGIGHIKWELEDLSFRYLEPEDYSLIARLLDEKRVNRQHYIDSVIELLHEHLANAGVEAEINGRAKHIYSIWKKMRRKGIGFSQVYDIRAVRILVSTVHECYIVLGIVHSLWRNIPNEFDDYIASPKDNGYRSLHTAVIGPDRKVLEVQIRTRAMHDEAEYGVCAHFLYKGTDSERSSESYEQKIEWLRQVLEWQEEVGGNSLHEDLSAAIEQDRIYVFTPDGHVIDLPKEATPLDFAYRVHTEVGHKCRGAKVNDRIVPLNYLLKTGEQVEILIGKNQQPSRDWLSPALGYLKTGRARAKVHQWFRQQAREQHIADGRALLDKEFRRLALENLDFEQLAKRLNLNTLDDLYAAVGASDLGVNQVLNTTQKMLEQDFSVAPKIAAVSRADEADHGEDIYISGVGNLMTHIARCCRPVPGDPITGYISRGRGIAIHRQDCSNILQSQSDEPERIIEVSWTQAPHSFYSVDVLVEAFDRRGLLRDITALLDSEHVNITTMQTVSDPRKHTVDMTFTIEIRTFDELSRVLNRLNRLPNVASARRKH